MAKAKTKSAYVCDECGAEHSKWQGQCGTCNAWNTLSRVNITPIASAAVGYAGVTAEVKKLSDIEAVDAERIGTGFTELDRVLGGGFVPGSVVLIGGDPGAGKSTLLLQASTALAQHHGVLYVTGEESLQQLALRAQRLQLPMDNLSVAAETRAEVIASLVQTQRPKIVILDSIQVMQMESVDSTPGSVAQVRETASFFTRLAKQQEIVIVLVGHITKEGGIAGPKVLEHMIDLLRDARQPGREPIPNAARTQESLRSRKRAGYFCHDRFGYERSGESFSYFLAAGRCRFPGSIATVTWEGTRPLLVELQALVDDVAGGHPKRVAVGLDQQRLAMHLAVLHRHCGIALSDQDVFANVVGGVRITETGADLALLLAVLGSFRDRVLSRELIVFGELGLTGELRPVANGQERLREAAKHGFKDAIVPFANRPKEPMGQMKVHGVKTLSAALEVLQSL